MHEAVAHYGLRQLMGEEFDTFLDDVCLSTDLLYTDLTIKPENSHAVKLNGKNEKKV